MLKALTLALFSFVIGCSDGRELTPISSFGSSGGPPDPVTCPYPKGEAFFPDVGGRLPLHTFVGFPEGYNESEIIDMESYHDCDGSRGIRALVVDSSAVWCEACGKSSEAFSKVQYDWLGKGIHVVTLLVQGADSQPADLTDVVEWKMKYGLTTATVVDPDMSYVGSSNSPGGMISLPVLLLVDPRTMVVVSRTEGFNGEIDPTIEELASNNSK